MMGYKRGKERIEEMGLRHRKAKFLHQPLEVLLGALLAMKANPVMDWCLAAAALLCEKVVLLGLFDPLPSRLFHKASYPCQRFLS